MTDIGKYLSTTVLAQLIFSLCGETAVSSPWKANLNVGLGLRLDCGQSLKD